MIVELIFCVEYSFFTKRITIKSVLLMIWWFPFQWSWTTNQIIYIQFRSRKGRKSKVRMVSGLEPSTEAKNKSFIMDKIILGLNKVITSKTKWTILILEHFISSCIRLYLKSRIYSITYVSIRIGLNLVIYISFACKVYCSL